MGANVGELNIKINTDTKEALSKLETYKQQAERTRASVEKSFKIDINTRQAERSLDSVIEKMDTIGNKISKTGAKMTKGITMPAVALGGFAFKQNKDFMEGRDDIATLLDENYKKTLADVMPKMKRTSSKFGNDMKDILSGTYQAISAGVDDKEVADFMEKIAPASIAGKATVEETVDLTTSILNSYNMSIKETESVLDSCFMTMKYGKTTLKEMAGSLPKLASFASMAGVSINELNTVIATLTSKGFSTDEAVIGIQGVLSGLISPSKEALDTMESINQYLDSIGEKRIDFSVQGLRNSGFKDFMGQIRDAIGPDNIEDIAKLFPNIRGTRALAGLLQEESWGDYEKFYDKITNSSGAVDEALGRMDSSVREFKVSLNALKNSLIDTGTADKFLEQATKIVNKITEFNEKMSPEQKERLANMIFTLAILGPVLKLVGGATSGTSDVLESFIRRINGAILPGRTLAEVLGNKGVTGSGKEFMSVGRPMVGLLGEIGQGFMSLPGPIKVVIGLLGMLTACSGLAIHSFNKLDNTVDDFVDKEGYREETGKGKLETLKDRMKVMLDGAHELNKMNHELEFNNENRGQIEKTIKEANLKLTRPLDVAASNFEKEKLLKKGLADVQDKFSTPLEIKPTFTGEISGLDLLQDVEKQVIEYEDGTGDLILDKKHLEKYRKDEIEDAIKEEVERINEEIDKIENEPIDKEFKINSGWEDFKKMNEEMEKAQEQAMKQMKEEQRINEEKIKQKQHNEEIYQQYKSIYEENKKQIGLFDKFRAKRTSEGRLLRNARKRAEAYQEQYRLMESLSEKIQDKDLLAEISKAGIEKLGSLRTLDKMSPETFQKWQSDILQANSYNKDLAQKQVIINMTNEFKGNESQQNIINAINESLKSGIIF